MQLQNAKAKFEQQGIRLAAISYDSQAILADFAKRYNIEKEHVPVFEGKFRITQDVTIPVSKVGAGVRALLGSANTVSIAGALQYQACAATICYPPTSAPVKWEVKVEPLDLHRSPENIRHK